MKIVDRESALEAFGTAESTVVVGDPSVAWLRAIAYLILYYMMWRGAFR
jgi:hypothetical protein